MAQNLKRGSSRSRDILIIGGGSAGLRAAIEAHDAAHVLIGWPDSLPISTGLGKLLLDLICLRSHL